MGQYMCIASNSEGEGESNQALLEIQCKQNLYGNAKRSLAWLHSKLCFCLFTVAPICRPDQVTTYNVGRGETAQILCEVEGIPRDINFVWKFNTSVSEVLDMPSSIVKNNSTQSTIHFKPMTEHVIWKDDALWAFPLLSFARLVFRDFLITSTGVLNNGWKFIHSREN